jgi:hypothetical protein
MKKIGLILAGVMLLSGVALVPASAQVEKTDGFVCPVFNDNSAVGAHNPNAVEIGGGDYTIIGPDVSVPLGATNGDGAGTPPGPHSVPGDSDYTAVWAG